MTLIKSISGIRGTIGGTAGDNLSPLDIVKYTSAYAQWASKKSDARSIVIGRDARLSGEMVSGLVVSTLCGMGFDVYDLGLATTPSVEMAVTEYGAAGGIIVTASHNPKQWNALKLLNSDGEFISAKDGKSVLRYAEKAQHKYADVDKLGEHKKVEGFLDKHIQSILDLKLVDAAAIRKRGFVIAVDAVNSVGGVAVPALLEALGVMEVVKLYCEPNGEFPHNPEPLPEHLSAISNEVQKKGADLGIVVDPDVDRLALVTEDGDMFGEEYTLVSVADYILTHDKGATVSNLSSTRALRDITEKHGCEYHASAVGEVNVVSKMKEVGAVIGGEGNGGIIYPELHYGRDALVGIALFLTHLAKTGKSASMLRSTYPNYHISKNKITLDENTDVDKILRRIKKKYDQHPINTEDGVKIEFDNEWVHLRKSNTEPIIRIYSESGSQSTADSIARKIMEDIRQLN